MKYLYLILLYLVSCTEFDYTPEYRIDSRFESYVNNFYKEAKQRNISVDKALIVRLDILESGVWGRTSYQGPQRIITINQDYYFDYLVEYAPKLDPNHLMIEQLLYHELGHALLYRDHCDPCYSIMAKDLSLAEYVRDPKKRELLINELFTIK